MGLLLPWKDLERFVAGFDPVIQAKCNEHGATSLEEALAIACKWERAQEVLRLAPLPPLSQKTGMSPNSSTALPSESLSAMVSTKTTAHGNVYSEVMTAIMQLNADVKALRMEVSQMKRQHASSRQRGTTHLNVVETSIVTLHTHLLGDIHCHLHLFHIVKMSLTPLSTAAVTDVGAMEIITLAHLYIIEIIT